jgi:chitinase
MGRAWLGMVALAALVACESIPEKSPPSSVPFRIVAYVAGWSMPATVPAEKLTHVNFAFARIDAIGRIAFQDPQFEAALASLVALKQRRPALRVLVSVGGWEAEGFSDAALTEVSRKVFAESAVEFVRRHRIDGIDIDWEYPGQGVAGIKFRSEDKQNFTRLLMALRRALNDASDVDGRAGDRYLLTIASADREYFEHTEMGKLNVYLDWINVMAYDFFNSLTPTTGHHAGLYASRYAATRDRDADKSIRQHLAAEIPSAKLVLGVAFYGRRFEGVDPAHDGLNRSYRKYGGDPSYAELADQLVDRNGFVRLWDSQASAPFLWNAATRTFISYDDPESIRRKAAYARDRKLGGVMFWELSQDRNGQLLDAIHAGAVPRQSPPAAPSAAATRRSPAHSPRRARAGPR